MFDPMSLLELDDDFSLNGSKRAYGSLANVAECVNPQCTDKRYGTTQLEFMTPEPSPTGITPRRESFALSENRSTYFSGSSASSFLSFSGLGTPSQLTPGSSASSSRRQSMLLPESQQCYFSSRSNRRQRPKRAAATDQCPLQESSPGSYIASIDAASLITDGAAVCTPGGEFTMVIDGYTGRAPPRQWQSHGPQNDALSFHERAAQPAHIDELTVWGRGLGADFSIPMAAPNSHTFESGQPLFGDTQPTIFERGVSQPNAAAYNSADSSSPNPPSLEPPFELSPGECDTAVEFADGFMVSNAPTARRSYLPIRQPRKDSSHSLKRSRNSPLKIYTLSPSSDDDLESSHAASPTFKSRSRRQKQRQGTAYKIDKDKPHRCGRCPYACNRPEHLRRHEDSKHRGGDVIMLPCAFHGCKDPKTNERREIQARLDNLKAHYTRTHFRYGITEKGGKNERKSMKAAQEMGLGIYDERWTLLLDSKMDVNHEIKDFLHVWKMLGYSIRETRDTRVKDVAPDWPVPEDETLQKYDPRWKALWNGTLTFDQAMDIGKDMKESEAQGLLGVTMLETEEMGIKHLDVRWVHMDNGRMSVEQSEKLGVKQKNPVWKDLIVRRKARGWVEKF
ncbi:MAG: hypothetical protein ASARMPRED_000566 [Alectoria sarmentosa]|nr:MAG: hypothetical protein ASARMPRED_000566 [Alectoria sarmentosa]